MKPLALFCLASLGSMTSIAQALPQAGGTAPALKASISLSQEGEHRAYVLRSEAPLRDNTPADHLLRVSELPGQPSLRTGNLLFDGLYAMTIKEALQNSVPAISNDAYGKGEPIQLEAFQTGEFWTYVWTRDLSYAVDLGLAGFDPKRAVNSLLFKTSETKNSVRGGFRQQIIQDTGSGGSYPVSTDRIVWALGAEATLKALPAEERDNFLRKVYPILRDTLEQDRGLIFDAKDGLYRGEQSFLDWREQTYPAWTKDQVLPLALSKALSTNVLTYRALRLAQDCATKLGQTEEAARYRSWAADLARSINAGFYDPTTKLYSSYLLSDGGPGVRVHRQDLLGEALAILSGVASPLQAREIIASYPLGPNGPSVVWPQDRSVPIYHNQAIWPFVTAYWLKAASQAGNAEAVEQGVLWLQKGAAENLSNMENLDFVTGLAEVKGHGLEGPVINSRRQLWSVGSYFSMVQDVLFGLETSWDGLRFTPRLPAGLIQKLFAGSPFIELRDYSYQGAKVTVRLHLPKVPSGARGFCTIARSELNGHSLTQPFAARKELLDTNQWDIYLDAPAGGGQADQLHWVDVKDENNYFGPSPATWNESQGGGITVEQGKLALHFCHPSGDKLLFNIYRDGVLVAAGWKGTDWVDKASADYAEQIHYYAIEAVDPVSGNAAHLTPSRSRAKLLPQVVIPARELVNRGGSLVEGHHFENWGKPDDVLELRTLRISKGGRHQVRVEFSNGNGPINTGIACGVKRLELLRGRDNALIASGYLIMPQSGDWQRWDLSSPIEANLSAGEDYRVVIREDAIARNMSYLAQNTRYTSWPGGGEQSLNKVNIASIRVSFLGATAP